MRRAAKVDANQAAMVLALRKFGASVQPLHSVGLGCPDLLVGWRGHNYLFEIKDGDKAPSRRGLTGDQFEWHRGWAGQCLVVNTEHEAIDFLCNQEWE